VLDKHEHPHYLSDLTVALRYLKQTALMDGRNKQIKYKRN